MMVAAMGLFGDLGDPRDIDAGVRAQLADSLAHIVSKAGSYLEVDRGRLDAAVEQIRVRKQDPGVFAHYFDLIFAVNANRFANANTLLEELIERASQPVSFAIVPYTREELGSDYERFAELLFAEFSKANPMASPSQSQSAASTQVLREAIAIISRVDQGIHDEIEAFLARIYLVIANKDPLAKRFGGVTSLLVWGASFINVEFYKTRWDAVQFLVHEITHSLLLGLSCDQPLVQNSPDENYKSPLRSEPRPMDGIFHATLVCARLAAFNRAWLDSGLVEAGDRDRSEETVARNSRFFQDGLAVVNQHGKLSEQARHLIDRSCLGLSVFA
jgi:hypothetical protein